MDRNFNSKKIMILYFGLIIAIAFFAIAYFSSYSVVKHAKYASEFELLRTEQQNDNTGFELVDVTDSVVGNTMADEDIVVTPIGIGKVPSLSDANRGEIKMYKVLLKNDGPISEAEKEMLTENLHWQEYITAPGDSLESVAKDLGTTVSIIRRANCLPDKVKEVKPETVLRIPDSDDDVEITRSYSVMLRDKAARAVREKNKMHPLLYVVQRGDTAATIARRFNLKEETLLSANHGKSIRPGTYMKIPTMNGIYIVVRMNDTVPKIARHYGSSTMSIMRANGLERARGLRVGMKLFIPNGKMPEERVFVSHSQKGRSVVFVPETAGSVGRFRWPCSGRVTSPFGYRHSPFRRRRRTVFHAGIDIAAPRGTAIVASASGIVTHSGWKSGYGKTIIIQHGNGFSTLYGHNSSLLVGAGAVVSRGQIIARMGSTGRSTGNHCHFEIRCGGSPTNPMRALR